MQDAQQTCSPEMLGQAWGWVLRLREESASAQDLAAWLQWYEADVRHGAAFEEMQALWHGAGELNPSRLAPEGLNVVVKARASRRLLGGFSIAAAIVLAIGYTFIAREGWAPASHQVSTAIVRETRLQDGSGMELAPNSTVEVRYSNSERVLDMRGNSGEAYFTVARNPQRPFIVKVGELRVRALGTAFNVRRAERRITVTVTEGLVEVYRADDVQGGSVRAKAGERVAWDLEHGAVPPSVSRPDVSGAPAWQKGRLDYLNEPLSAVVADVNRYSVRRTAIADDGARGMLVSGTVFIDDVDAWVDALPQFLPLEIRRTSGGNVVLASEPK